jgi:hypothetical protein
MRFRLAVIGLLLAAAGAPAEANQTGDPAAALAAVAAALDGAEKAAASCPQPEAQLRVRHAIFDARKMLQVARSSAGALLALNEKMETLRRALAQCLSFKELAEQYHAKCQGDARLGMTREEVRRTAWCEPTKIMRTDTQDHSREEWIYTVTKQTVWLGRPEGFLYFTDGRLSSIERAVP